MKKNQITRLFIFSLVALSITLVNQKAQSQDCPGKTELTQFAYKGEQMDVAKMTFKKATLRKFINDKKWGMTEQLRIAFSNNKGFYPKADGEVTIVAVCTQMNLSKKLEAGTYDAITNRNGTAVSGVIKLKTKDGGSDQTSRASGTITVTKITKERACGTISIRTSSGLIIKATFDLPLELDVFRY